MQWIYLSPHFDDVALSCGGLVWTQVQRGDTVSIWTVCAGMPDPSRQPLSPFAQALHARWGTGLEAVLTRQAEDTASCQVLGATTRRLAVLDCIYRTNPQGEAYYASEEALNGPLHPQEAGYAAQLSAQWRACLPPKARLVCPLSLGNHVDHQLTRLAAEGLGRELWYYADYPYVLRHPEWVAVLVHSGWKWRRSQLSAPALVAWQESVAAHTSQISTFWLDESHMRVAIAEYAQQRFSTALWRSPQAG